MTAGNFNSFYPKNEFHDSNHGCSGVATVYAKRLTGIIDHISFSLIGVAPWSGFAPENNYLVFNAPFSLLHSD
jgi:hypothetical protein